MASPSDYFSDPNTSPTNYYADERPLFPDIPNADEFLPVDIDNDGDIDIFIETGTSMIIMENNENNGTFTKHEFPSGNNINWASGAVAVDMNDDGLLDFAVDLSGSRRHWWMSQNGTVSNYSSYVDPFLGIVWASQELHLLPPCALNGCSGDNLPAYNLVQSTVRFLNLQGSLGSLTNDKFVFWLWNNETYPFSSSPAAYQGTGNVYMASYQEVATFLQAVGTEGGIDQLKTFDQDRLAELPTVHLQNVIELDGRFNEFDIADLDGDGYPDLISSSSIGDVGGQGQGQLIVRYGKPPSDPEPTMLEFDPPILIANASRIRHFSVEDFDGDGLLDIIYTDFKEGFILQNSGDRTWEAVQFYQFGGTSRYAPEMFGLYFFMTTDVNNDGRKDFLMFGYDKYYLYVALQMEPLSEDAGMSFTGMDGTDKFFIDGEFWRTHVADVNGDGLEEILYTTRLGSRPIQVVDVSRTFPPTQLPTAEPTDSMPTPNSSGRSFFWCGYHLFLASIVLTSSV